ncbi:kinetochore protein SPC24 homolog [Pyrus x bretschneideri]|uniref:kinetochore protein SPC24 homolog n=1 Tax=Pyrus x bretschneideri TaxID=225117 RepID=UPI000511A729|nr:kinetochore protein SPC24 homolog [Pyrus x bretschneideri]
MGEASGISKLISYSDDLVKVLKDQRDITNLARCLQHYKALRSSCNSDFNEVQNSLRDYEIKTDECKQKTEAAKLEVVADEELDRLQREFDGDAEIESSLMEEIRVLGNEISEFERQRISVQEKKRNLKRHEQDEFREQRKLSMYASVTNIIPNLENKSRDMGYIVDSNKKIVQKFEFDPTKMTASETCDSIWKMISS